jgi:DNA-binding NtrC family response regulator
VSTTLSGSVTVRPKAAAPAEAAQAILYVQASSRERPAVKERIARLGVPFTLAGDVADAVRALSERRFGLALLDLADDRAALSAIRMLRGAQPSLPLAGVVDPANPSTAAEAMHAGLIELLPWPFDEADVLAVLANARERAPLDRRAAADNASTGGLFVQSPAMRQLLEAVRAAAASRRGVLIAGEPGSGRSVVARAVHDLGRAAGEFVAVDCATAPRDLEATLFGTPPGTDDGDQSVERIAVESALRRADGGTLYLTNLTEAPARIQMRLARLLRDREAHVEGASGVIELDVRPVASVQPDMESAMADGRLRRDLADRLAPPRLDVPPLSRRREDIPLLALLFLGQAGVRHPAAAKTFSRAALSVLAALPWHGNAGELRDLVERLARSIHRPVIQLDDVLDHVRLDGLSSRIDQGISLRDAKARFERECISAVLIRHHGRVGEAAKALGIQRTNLYRKVRQLNVARSLLSARR